MKILLTGACGNLGRGIIEVAGDAHEIVPIDITPEIEALGGTVVNTSDGDAVAEAAAGCDAIVHTAAMHGSSFGKATDAEFITANVTGGSNIYQAAVKHHIRRVVMSSSMEVIYGNTWNEYGTAITDESTPPRPNWIYPLTKLQAEQMGHYYARLHGLEVVQLRYANILRPSSIRKMGFQPLARGVHVHDHARAVLLSLTTPGLRDEIFHLAPDTPLTQQDIEAAFVDPWPVLEKYWPGCERVLKENDLVPKSRWFWPVTRIDRAKRILGWQPEWTFAEVLKAYGWSPPSDTSKD